MTARPDRALTDAETAVLLYFFTEAEDGVGWCRLGVRGWRFRLEVEHHFPNAYQDAIKQLRAWRLLGSCPVPHMKSDPLLRISRAGAELVKPGGEFEVPDQELLYHSYFIRHDHEWATLQSFRRAREDRSVPLRFGRRGWVTIFEVRRFGASDTYSASALARLGLLEQRREVGPAGKPVLYSRATAAGMRLVIVREEWDGGPKIEMVEVADAKDAENLPDCPW